jgi:hypothetical protein
MGFFPVDNNGGIFTSDPNFDLLKNQKELSYAQLVSLLDELNNASMQSAQELEDSSFFSWLSFALGCAVALADTNTNTNSNLQTNPITLITSLVQNFLNNSPDALYAMFNQQINEGRFKGQSFVYFWMDNYFSLAYSSNDDLSSFHALNIMFHELLNVLGSQFCSLLVKNIEEGSEKGKNALLVLLRSYQKSTERAYNELEVQDIADLFLNCMKKEPDLMAAALTQEITEGLFRGKSCLYLLSGILLKSTLFGYSHSVTIIQDVMLHTLKSHPEQFADALYKCHTSGPYSALSSFHLILLSLVEAAYKDKNSVVIAQLMSIITELATYDKREPTVISALLETINNDVHQDLNGFVFLCRALIAAMTHHIDVTPMMDFILDVIKRAPAEQLVTAVFQWAPAHATPEYTSSPIHQLIQLAGNMNQPIQQQNAQVIINALAHSQAASRIYSLLPPDEHFFFVKETNPKTKDLLVEPFVPEPAEIAGTLRGASIRFFSLCYEEDESNDVAFHFPASPM